MSPYMNLDAIRERRRQIAAEMARLKAEDDELEIAVRVFDRYTKKSGVNGHDKSPKLGAPRPEGIPSLFEMTSSIIQSAVDAGKLGLKGREIVDEIGNRFWPGVQPHQVLPAIYGFAKNGRLVKKGDKFQLPHGS
jgi:hypothetical protein